jgi:hypothetical protein
MMNWLMNHVFDRQGYRDYQAECARLEENQRALRLLEARIRETFTPEEWRATQERCEAQLARMGYDR